MGQQAGVFKRDVAQRNKDCFVDCEKNKKNNNFSDLKMAGNIGSVSGPIVFFFFFFFFFFNNFVSENK